MTWWEDTKLSGSYSEFVLRGNRMGREGPEVVGTLSDTLHVLF